jgi:hypothetical protein
LRQKGEGADDGAGHHLREESDEAGQIEDVRDRAQLAAIDVDRVAHRMERVEAHADGDDDVQRVHARGQAEPLKKSCG